MFSVERWQKIALLVFSGRLFCVSAKTKCAIFAWAFQFNIFL